MLSWRQADYPWPQFGASKEATFRPTRIVVSVFQPDDGIELPERHPVFERGRHRFDRLFRQRPSAIAIPKHLRTNRRRPMFAYKPMDRQLAGHHQRSWIPLRLDLF